MVLKPISISMCAAVVIAGMLTLCLVTTKPLANQAFAVPYKCPDTRLTINVDPSSGSMVSGDQVVKLSGNLSCGLNHAGVGGATILLTQKYPRPDFHTTTITDSSGNYHVTPNMITGLIYISMNVGTPVKLLAKYDGKSGNIHAEPATTEITVHYTRQQ